MKRTGSVILMLIVILSLTGCQEVMYDEADYIEIARKEFPVFDAEIIEMKFIGEIIEGDHALLWFMSGNEYQAHQYLPMSCTITKDGGRVFEKAHKTLERGTEIVVLADWYGGYAFCVNNLNCKTIKIDDYTGVKEIAVTEYPFIYYNGLLPREYLFLDENGDEIH